MKLELRDKWCAALRSGEYDQTKGVLYDPEVNGYCCLGVLGRVVDADLDAIEDIAINGFPNGEFLQSVGLHKDYAHELAGMNDSTYDFHMIADAIERDVRGVTIGLWEEDDLLDD